jgi:hypothetical protein
MFSAPARTVLTLLLATRFLAEIELASRWLISAGMLIPEQAAHRFRDDAAHPFRLIAARRSD